MKLKELFKLNWKKITIFFVLLVILIIIFGHINPPLQYVSSMLSPLALENSEPESASCHYTFHVLSSGFLIR